MLEDFANTLALTSFPFGSVQSMVRAYFGAKKMICYSEAHYSPRHFLPLGVDVGVHISWSTLSLLTAEGLCDLITSWLCGMKR